MQVDQKLLSQAVLNVSVAHDDTAVAALGKNPVVEASILLLGSLSSDFTPATPPVYAAIAAAYHLGLQVGVEYRRLCEEARRVRAAAAMA